MLCVCVCVGGSFARYYRSYLFHIDVFNQFCFPLEFKEINVSIREIKVWQIIMGSTLVLWGL